MKTNFEASERLRFNEEEILPLQVIRQHCKADDTPHVSDDMIEIYRATALEQCALYTGRIVTGLHSIVQTFQMDASHERRPRKAYRAKLAYLPLEKFIFFRGSNGSSERVMVSRNSKKVDIPVTGLAVNMGNCCAGEGLILEGTATYETGYRSKDDIPSTMLYGCLKFIAWSIGNPGDELMTVRNRLGTTETGLIGTNNAAWASGAVEHWRTYKVE